MAFAFALATPAAHAQDRESPEEPALVPPRPVLQAEPRYPENATGAASIVLEVIIEADGSIGEVKSVDGGEPFASAAIEAVRQYRFEPARRGDKTVRARIRMVVGFTPPEPAPRQEEEPAPAEALPVEPASPTAHVDEVTITGTRAKPLSTPTEHRLGRAEVRLVPGAFGDPFRAIDILPGVVPTVSGLPYYYIRGAPPSAVGYYVDEVRVPYLFHFALGPGVVQPVLLDEVSLHPAAFPGRFGRFAGGIVAGKTRGPATELTGEGQIRLFDAGAYVETPFAHGRGSVGIGGRYSYTAGLISLFAPDTTVDYRDYNARASWEIDERWRVSALALGSFDYASQMEREPPTYEKRENVLFASEFHRLDIRFDRRGDKGAESRIAMTIGLDRTRIEAARFAQDFLFGARGRHGFPLNDELDLEFGLDTMIDRYTGDLPSIYAVGKEELRHAQAFFSPRIESATGAWASAMWHPYKGFDLTLTARGDVFTSDGVAEVGPSPRASMRVPLGSKLAFVGALGVAPQPPAFAIPVPAIGYRRLPGGLGYGYQKSAGAEVELPLRFSGRAVGFHHSYFNLRDFARDTENFSFEDEQPPPMSPAQAYGLELWLSRKLSERFGAFVSYTLSRTVLGPAPGLPERISPFDRTHVLQVGGSADLGKGWRASARFLTYRGWPDEGSDPTSRVPIARLPPFFRVDARIEKRWVWRKTGHISLVLEALNATGTKEIVGRECDPVRCKDEEIGPIVAPSLGVEGAL